MLADFIHSEAIVLTEEQIDDPTIPVPLTTGKELYDRYYEWLICSGIKPGPYDTKAREDDDDAIQGIYLKPDTLAAKRLVAHGKKYPKFRETVEYEKWKAKKAIDE